MSVPTPRSDLNTRLIEEEVVILDRANGTVHRLNATAAAIWNLCDGQRSAPVIAEQISATYELDPGDALREVSRTIADFERLGLLDAAPGDDHP